MQEIQFKIVELINSDRNDGNFNIIIKMVSLYEDGKFIRHVKLNQALVDAIKDGSMEI